LSKGGKGEGTVSLSFPLPFLFLFSHLLPFAFVLRALSSTASLLLLWEYPGISRVIAEIGAKEEGEQWGESKA
jgi:hypothetical protein